MVSNTHVFSVTVINDARIGYSRHNGSFEVAGMDEGFEFARQNNIAVYPFPALMFPNIVFSPSGLTSGSQTFTALGSGSPNLNIENNFHFSDDLSMRKGSHSFKLGGDLRRPASMFCSAADRQSSGPYLVRHPMIRIQAIRSPISSWAIQRK
ncbi:MAG: hypothetical protein L0220_33080 [Acidobacteria bacterium]|nr:hypothetical protein [Acidobacteriota bacterium]